MTDPLAEVEAWVRTQLAAARRPGIADISQVAAHPRRELVAVTLSLRRPDDPYRPVNQVAVVDLVSQRHDLLDLGAREVSAPQWAPDGDRLCVLASADGPPSAWVVEVGLDDGSATARVTHRLPELAGAVEHAAWSPDGGSLAVLVAQFGAERSDVYGSGTVAGPAGARTWQPSVSPAPDHGRRLLHVWEPGGSAPRSLCPALNVWEAGWMGSERLVALTSAGAGEGDWYAAELVAVDLDGTVRSLYVPDRQLAAPAGNPSGTRWSVIAGPASDRGLLAGSLVVGASDAPGRAIEIADTDLTATRWLDDDRIGYVGLRGLRTVYGIAHLVTGSCTELLVTDHSSGVGQPESGAHSAAGVLVCVLERHDVPPTLTAVTDGVPRPVLSLADDDTRRLSTRLGDTRRCTWRSADGLEIEGMLTVPPGEGPHPLVLDVHGGPISAWRDGWPGKDPYLAVLVARGFAVLRPNPRGSAGRGAGFAEAVIGDMGGADTYDLLAGVEAMVEQGVTTPGRIAITGNSYGGYMAAWLPCLSEVFSAAASRSPVTDWRSQHLTSNLAEFDRLFLDGDPFDPQSQYGTRSPLLVHERIRTPMLFTAGVDDLATPAGQALQLHRALQRTGTPTEFALYPEEGHGVRGHDALCDQLARMIQWFERFLDSDSEVEKTEEERQR